MNRSLIHASCLLVGTCAAHAETIPVNADNYAKAESAWNFDNWAKLGSDTDLFHYRDVAPAGHDAPTVRMNWDSLYSNRIVKVSDDGTFTITLPETELYISAQVIDEDGFSPYYIVETGKEHTINVDTDYAWVLFRTGVPDRHSKDTLATAHEAQDGIVISGIMEDGAYVMPGYDQAQLEDLRTAYKQEFLDSGMDFTFARAPGEVDQHILDLSHAAGWGGYPPELGVSNAYSSSKTFPGTDCRAITFDDPQNKFFTSFTLYDAGGYLFEGNSYISSYEWDANVDGSITLHFNCDGDLVNSLSSGGQPFNFTIRNYGVSQAVLDGKFKPVDLKVAGQ